MGTKKQTKTTALPLSAKKYIARIQKDDVPAMLDAAYPGYADRGPTRMHCFIGKSVDMLQVATVQARGQKPLSALNTLGVASSTKLHRDLCELLLSNGREAEVTPSGFRLDQGIVLKGRVVAVLPEDLRFLAKLIADAREQGSEKVSEKLFRSNVKVLLADAAAFEEAMEKGVARVIGR